MDQLLEFYEQARFVTTENEAGAFAPYLEILGREADALWVEAARVKELKTALRKSEKQLKKLSEQYNGLKLHHDLMWQTLRDSLVGRWLLQRVKRLLRHAPVPAEEKDGSPEATQVQPRDLTEV